MHQKRSENFDSRITPKQPELNDRPTKSSFDDNAPLQNAHSKHEQSISRSNILDSQQSYRQRQIDINREIEKIMDVQQKERAEASRIFQQKLRAAKTSQERLEIQKMFQQQHTIAMQKLKEQVEEIRNRHNILNQ